MITKHTWAPGNHLRAADKAHVLQFFTHRPKGVSDKEWLANTLFAMRKDGGLDKRVHVCLHGKSMTEIYGG
jgi:hypothetical protein